MKKAFTLIELLIVICIISLLLGIGMNFGNNRIVELKVQTMKERFVDDYDVLLSQRLISSYQGTTRYHQLVISFDSGIVYSFDSGSAISLLPASFQLTGITFDGQAIDRMDLFVHPYQLSCDFSSSGNHLSFRLIHSQIPYCFSIDQATCRLRESSCSLVQ